MWALLKIMQESGCCRLNYASALHARTCLESAHWTRPSFRDCCATGVAILPSTEHPTLFGRTAKAKQLALCMQLCVRACKTTQHRSDLDSFFSSSYLVWALAQGG